MKRTALQRRTPLDGGEEWCSIPGIENYSVSTLGRVRRTVGGKGAQAGRILRPNRSRKHNYVALRSSGACPFLRIDRLVLTCFHSPQPLAHEPLHHNGDARDDCLENLSWAPVVASLDGEVWGLVAGFGETYSVSTLGRVRRNVTAKGAPAGLLSPGVNGGGYARVYLSGEACDNCGILVHRLVLETFVGPAPDGHETRHLNGDPADNRLENLAWGTPKENAADKVAHGRRQHGEQAPTAKLTWPDVAEIRKRLSRGEGQRSLAREFGVCHTTVYSIANERSWVRSGAER